MAKSYDEYRLGEPYEPPRRKGLKVFAILAALLAITILPALAAKGGNSGGKGHNAGGTTSGGGTLSLVLLDSTDGSPHWGQHVTFDVSATATTRPMVGVTCTQGGMQVYSMTAGFFPDYPWTTTYTLKSNAWTSGAADCTASLYYIAANGKEPVLATLPIHVEA
jgi:hypothetical protein